MDDGTGLQYFLSDHLGSVVAVTDASGTLISQQRYLPFGGVRENVGNISQTDYGYTGQRNLDAGIGLMDYKARFYSPYLNRFIQPDTIIPNPADPQSWNRYTYVGNRPINFNDPTGHVKCEFDAGGNDYCYENDRKSTITTFNPSSRNSDSRANGENSVPSKSGTLYFNMEITTNAEMQKNTLAYKAEESYGGFGSASQLGPITTNPAYQIDLANNMASLTVDHTANANFYLIAIEVHWSQFTSGVLIHSVEINNNTPTAVYVDQLIFSSGYHKPNIRHPDDVRVFGSPENYTGNNGTIHMNLGVALPTYQSVMTIQVATTGGFPEAPYISFSLKNLPPGCSSPFWVR